MKVYPNPVKDILKIVSGDEITTVMLYDIYGRLIEAVAANCQSLEMDVEFLAEGIYFVRIETAGKVVTRKIIKGL